MPDEEKKAEQGDMECKPHITRHFLSITYMIYIICYESLIWGGCGYVVFFLNYSGAWFLLAILASGSAYPPHKWNGLLTGKKENGE